MQEPSPEEIVREAVARNAAVVLSLPSAGMLRHHKSRFLAATADTLIVESVPGEQGLIAEVIGAAKPVGISFKAGINKVIFGTPAIAYLAACQINATTAVQALRLRWPTVIKKMQRRANYRVRLGPDAEMSARVWRINATARLADRPPAGAELKAQLVDLSTGGLGVVLTAARGEPLRIDPADRLRVEILHTRGTILLQARLRHPVRVPKDATTHRAGIQFTHMQDDIDGRHAQAALTKMLGELQRSEARRLRLGLMGW